MVTLKNGSPKTYYFSILIYTLFNTADIAQLVECPVVTGEVVSAILIIRPL